MSRGKKYQAIKEAAPANAVSITDAVAFLKDHAAAAFDETVEVHIRLGVDPQKSDQLVRGSVQLPHGTPKAKKVAVFTSDSKVAKEAKAAGAVVVGGDDLVKQVEEEGKLDADIAIASPDMMPKIAKIARILGPKGLMPNPKTGTVTPNVVDALKDLSGGKVSYKMDQLGNLHEAVAKLSWEADRITENITAFLESAKANRPAAQKGEFIRSVTVATTMGPGLRIS